MLDDELVVIAAAAARVQHVSLLGVAPIDANALAEMIESMEIEFDVPLSAPIRITLKRAAARVRAARDVRSLVHRAVATTAVTPESQREGG